MYKRKGYCKIKAISIYGGHMNKNLIRILAAVVIGGGIFAVLYWVLGAPLLITIAVGAVAAFVLFLFTVTLKRTKEQTRKTNIMGITPDMVAQVVSQSKAKIQEIYNFSYVVKKPEVKERILKIVTTGEKIVKDFQTDPKDIKAARSFIHYYLDATIRILDCYVKYTKGETIPDDLKERVAKIEDALDTTLQQAFENQYQKQIHDDGIELDVELEMLTKMVENDRMK